MSKFSKYVHVERYGRDEVAGILDGVVYVQPKIDGTNASVWCDPETGELCAGSRNRRITPEKDNAGFAAYVLNSDDPVAKTLRDYCSKNPGLIVYGEWLGDPTNDSKMVGSLRKYISKGFFAFDVREMPRNDETGRNLGYVHPRDVRYSDLAQLLGSHFVPSTVLDHPTIEQVTELAEGNHFNLPDDVVGEGVVIKNYDYRDAYGNMQMAKVVLDEWRERQRKNRQMASPRGVETMFCDEVVTGAFLDKCRSKVADKFGVDFDSKDKRHMGMFMSLIVTDAISEDTYDFVKRNKFPTIDFGQLKGIIQKRGREFVGVS